jgi:hypothetical protein
MTLHRDIFWIGRQWAVTGSGVQAIDQRLRGALDIAIERLWDEGFVRERRAKPGINTGDFDEALAKARQRFPPITEPAAASAPPAFVLRAEGRLARFLPQWRVRR